MKGEAAKKDRRRKPTRRVTRKQYSAEEKIRIVLEGLRGEDSIASCRGREGTAQNLYYRWSESFLEAGGGTLRFVTRLVQQIMGRGQGSAASRQQHQREVVAA